MSEREIDIFDKFFPRISPENLPTFDKLYELRCKLEKTHQWRLMRHLPRQTIRLGLSNFTEKAIPWIHLILEDDSYKSSFHKSKGNEKKATIFGIALHEGLSLFDLIRYRRLNEDQIMESFPTYSRKSLEPFFDVFRKRYRDIGDLWKQFHTDSRLVDNKEYSLSSEFAELPLNITKEEELELRQDGKIYDAGINLAHNLGMYPENEGSVYSEIMAIFNFNSLSSHENTIQIPVKYDRVISRSLGRKITAYEFFDLKTGKFRDSVNFQFQALLMNFLAGHFVDQFFDNRKIEYVGSALTSRRINHINPFKKNVHFEYGFFDSQNGEMLKVPIFIDYNTDHGQLFLEWLSFYADAFCAFKMELKNYLRFGRRFDRKNLDYYQFELPIEI